MSEPAACLNCGQPLPAPRPRYCGACGQETNIRPPRLSEFVQQFGGAYFATEGALWRTLALLLARPGELTRRYLAGRRRHYVLPLRLYLTISLLTLFALRLAAPVLELDKDSKLSRAEKPPNVVLLGFGPQHRAGIKDGVFFCEGYPAWICTRLQARLDLDPKSFAREVKLWPERFLARWGTAMFLLVPIFAALLKLAYLGRGLRYTEHLVFALHVHSFWFLALALTLVPVPGIGLAYLAMPVYALLAARRVYGGGWFANTGRMAALAMMYGLVLVVALGVVAMWAFFFN